MTLGKSHLILDFPFPKKDEEHLLYTIQSIKTILRTNCQTNRFYCSSFDFHVNQNITILTQQDRNSREEVQLLYIIFCSQIRGNNLQLKSCPSLQVFKIQESPNYWSMRKNMCPRLQFKVFRIAKRSVCYIQVFKPERYETKVCP